MNYPITEAFGCGITIDTDALAYNYGALTNYISRTGRRAEKTKAAAVVKADAYGHGADICVPVLHSAGCRFFCVASLDEAIRVRRILGEASLDSEILILGATPVRYAEYLSIYNITQTVFSAEYGKALDAAARASGHIVKIHLKLDTGMNRLGFSDARSLETFCGGLETLRVCGIFSHLANATDRAACREQLKGFFEMQACLEACGISAGIRHLSASEGFFTDGDCMLDMVRLGISLYGYGKPSPQLPPLRPVMSLNGTIVHIHTLKKGESVGYGGEYTATGSDRIIATVCGGYADGILRAYKGGRVRIVTDGGVAEAPICGRICMDMFMADVTSLADIESGAPLSARVRDRVIVFGEDDGASLRSLAGRAQTIEYECLCAAAHSRGKRKIMDRK